MARFMANFCRSLVWRLCGYRSWESGESSITPPTPHWIPAKDATGLNQTELEQLHRAITDDIADTFRRRAVPLLVRSEQSPDVTPRLEVDISWSRIKPDTVGINVTTRLMEAARLIKDPSKIVWAQSWGDGLFGYRASPESLAKEIRHVALGGVNQFLDLYARAHAH